MENQFIQWNCCQQRRHPRSGTWTSCRPLPRCSWRATPSPPWSWRSGPWFRFEALLWPSIQRRPMQNSPLGCRQGSWEARSSSPAPPWGSYWANPASSCCYRQGCLCTVCRTVSLKSHLSCSHKLTLISRSSRSNKFIKLPFIIVNSIHIEVSRSPETIQALVAHCRFIFAGMWPFVFVYGSANSWDSLDWKIQ